MFVGLIILMSMMMDIWWLEASIACVFRCDEIGKMTSGQFYSLFGIRCPVHTLETIAGSVITQEVRSTHRNAVDTSVMIEIV